MPNGPEDRARVFGDAANRRKLALQGFARVMMARDPNDFEDLISSAAEREMMLHSWNIGPDSTIIAVFYPGTEEALHRSSVELGRNDQTGEVP